MEQRPEHAIGVADVILVEILPREIECRKGQVAISDDSGLGLRRVLETVADGFDVERRDGSVWVLLTKRLAVEAAG